MPLEALAEQLRAGHLLQREQTHFQDCCLFSTRRIYAVA